MEFLSKNLSSISEVLNIFKAATKMSPKCLANHFIMIALKIIYIGDPKKLMATLSLVIAEPCVS